MRIELTKGSTADRMDIRRSDGSHVTTSFPHKGPVPHDVVHFFVESAMGIVKGFWGMVAEGHHPEEIGAIAKAAGHASATRCSTPDPSFVPAIQAERIVECFEADLWGGRCDPQTFIAMVDAGCKQSLVPTPVIEPDKLDLICGQIAAFREKWVALPIDSRCTLDWPVDEAE